MSDENHPRRRRTLRWAAALFAVAAFSLLGAFGLLASLFWPTFADELYLKRYRQFEPSATFAESDADFSDRLTSLEFEAPATDNSVVEGMHVLSRLERLKLRDTQVDDSVGPALRRHPNLKYVDLSGTRVTDAIIEDLIAMPQLKEVDLRGTQVTEPAARRLDAAHLNEDLDFALGFEWPHEDEQPDGE